MSYKNLRYSCMKYIKPILLLVFLIFFSGGIAVASDSLRTEVIDGKKFIIHEIEAGETLFALSRRYNASVEEISRENDLNNYSISVGQILRVPLKVYKISGIFHTVDKGETLYSISRTYEVSVDDIKRWNHLVDNNISIGQKLSIGSQMPDDAPLYQDEEEGKLSVIDDENKVVESSIEVPEGSSSYYVQAGESLASIANKFNVSADSIQIWNNMRNRKVKIGQALIFPFDINAVEIKNVESGTDYRETAYGSKYKIESDGGVSKLYEEGLAKTISSRFNTSKYLALHRTLSVGTVFQVKNLMNNQTIYVRVVGKLPNTGINEGIMIRLTPQAFERLGIIDEKARVGITYFDE
jgi:LysM repeat protein